MPNSDLSRFDGLKDNLPFALFGVLFGFFGAGFFEEVVFRGFLMTRLADCLHRTRTAWAVAVVAQGAIFGLAHLYQGLYGVFYTGILGTLLGWVVLKMGRNLWPAIIGHGVYDAARFIYFHILLTYTDLETLANV